MKDGKGLSFSDLAISGELCFMKVDHHPAAGVVCSSATCRDWQTQCDNDSQCQMKVRLPGLTKTSRPGFVSHDS